MKINIKKNPSNILPTVDAKLSSFDLSERNTTTIPLDTLIPVYWQELNPGDRFKIKVSSLARLMPLVAPIMSDIELTYVAFWCSNDLLWKNWKEFMGEKVYTDANPNRLVPSLDTTSPYCVKVGSIYDYMGLPVSKDDTTNNIPAGLHISSLPFRMYNKIYNDWIRAVDLVSPITQPSGDEKDKFSDYSLKKILKKSDYFVSCLPAPQAGEAVKLPLIGSAPVTIDRYAGDPVSVNFGDKKYTLRGEQRSSQFEILPGNEVFGSSYVEMFADMSNVTGISVEELRRMSALQVLLEKDLRYGERYQELVKAHWGVDLPDWLSGRALFVGSATSKISVNPIVQQSSTDATTPQGNLVGVGVGTENEFLCDVPAMEHGHLMILCYARSNPIYFQGLDKKFSKSTRFDYYFPEFQDLGDEVVRNQEIFLGMDKVENEKTFGYQERYRRDRESYDRLTGLMRPGVKGSLAVWNLAEQFANLPKLNVEFMESSTPIERTLAVKNQPPLMLDILFDVLAVRPLSVSSHPSLLAGRI